MMRFRFTPRAFPRIGGMAGRAEMPRKTKPSRGGVRLHGRNGSSGKSKGGGRLCLAQPQQRSGFCTPQIERVPGIGRSGGLLIRLAVEPSSASRPVKASA